MSFGSLFLASATLTFMILILAIFDGYVNSSAQGAHVSREALSRKGVIFSLSCSSIYCRRIERG
jgi:hypothetical protein